MRVQFLILPLLIAAAPLCFPTGARGQAPPPPTAQKESMAKLAYWTGTWKGKGTVYLGPGQVRESDVTETLESKLDGLLITMEGKGISRGADGKETVTHNAFGVVWYDPAAKQYRMKSFVMQGFTTDSELKPVGDGYEWGFKPSANGPAFRYTIHNSGSEWHEVGEMSTDGQAWRKIFEMRLQKQK